MTPAIVSVRVLSRDYGGLRDKDFTAIIQHDHTKLSFFDVRFCILTLTISQTKAILRE